MSDPAVPSIRVLVVDDQPLIRRGLALALDLEDDIRIVGQAADGAQALQLAREHHPDIVLMDLQMPGMGGVAATRALAIEQPEARVVVLTTYDTDELVFDAIRAGAQAYLLKDASEAVLLETIRAVHRGEVRLPPDIARKVMDEFRRVGGDPVASPPRERAPAEAGGGPPSSGDGTESLTAREARVLELVAQGYSNKEIARAMSLAEGTVKNHVSRIMDKLHARSRTELAVKALDRRAG